MRKLMPYHASQLVIIEHIEQPRRHRHGITIAVYATGKGIELRVVHYVYLGHIHIAGHAEVLDDIVHPRVLPAFQRTRPRGMAYHGGIGEISHGKPHPYDAHHPGQHRQEVGIYRSLIKLMHHVAINVIIAIA